MKKQALLIGINDYQILPELKYARQDAEAVEQSLKQNYCFSDDEVILLTDAKPGLLKPTSQRIVLTQLENLTDQELDLFIFGFWGHGVVRNGRRYLCPLNVMPDAVEEDGVPFDVLMNLLTKIRARNMCLILDCCQKVHDRGESETFTAEDQKAIENAARDIVLRRKEKTPEFASNVAILNSCKQGQSAYEWDKRQHGIFTAHLLDAFSRRIDSIAKIVSYINSNVEKTAMELGKKQTPLCSMEGDIPLPVDTKSSPLVTGDIFISYRHCNADLVAPVEEELKKRGISYFIDRVGINYGMEYADAITQAILASKIILFVWTPEVKGSNDIVSEVTMALQAKKVVMPYKIGTFNSFDHPRLCYHLSPLSRYEVPQQTQKTVSEIVNRIEMALSGKPLPLSSSPIKFELPKNSSEAVIEQPEIEDIVANIAPVSIEQKSIEYNTIQLPPLPKELLNIQAENKGREIAIVQLKDFTHESLEQANAAVAQAQAQFDAWKERKERLWKDMPKDIQQTLDYVISSNPQCSEANLYGITNNMSNQEYFNLLERFQCRKKYELARLELERVQKQRQEKCEEIIKQFQQKIETNKEKTETIRIQFLDEVLLSILVVMPGYNEFNAPFPEYDITTPLQVLDQYELGWRAPDEISRARILWNENRPCVIERKQVEEQQRIEREQSEREILGKIFDAIQVLSYPGKKAGERKSFVVNDVEFAFRWAPPGSFMMGSPESEKDREYDEIQHRVVLSKGFWIMETQVTQKQWFLIMGNNPSNFQGDNLPVENVTRKECKIFCRKVGLKLPTEAQWEYACRAGSTGAFAGNLDTMAWYSDNSGGTTHPVGTKKPNAWGLYDMHGNVSEWCSDRYGGYPRPTKPGLVYLFLGYNGGSVTDPKGPSEGSGRIVRGGSWNCDAEECRSAFRDDYKSYWSNNYIGFRCVKTP